MPSKRMLVGMTILIGALLALNTSVASATPTSRTEVCHKTGRPSGFVSISIPDSAISAHLGHGDAFVGDAVPAQPGMEFGDDCTPVASTALLGTEIDGCVTTVTAPQFCPAPPTDPRSFTALTSTVIDPGIEFSSSNAGIQADFDNDSLTLTVLGGYFDLYFVFSSVDWTIISVDEAGVSSLGVSDLQFDENTIIVSTDDTLGELYPHTATFEITAIEASP